MENNKTKDGRPPCANDNCKSGYGAITSVNGKFYCGDCAIIATTAKKKLEDNAIAEAFKNG